MDGWIEEWMEERMNGRMDERIVLKELRTPSFRGFNSKAAPDEEEEETNESLQL